MEESKGEGKTLFGNGGIRPWLICNKPSLSISFSDEENIASISLGVDGFVFYLLANLILWRSSVLWISETWRLLALPRGAAKEVRIRGRAETGGAEDLGPFCSVSCRAVGETIIF